MFLIFVALTLYITYWASKRVRSRSDIIPPAAILLASRTGWRLRRLYVGSVVPRISALVYTSGYDG
ncbi:acetate permease ActP [Klebsiella aerogenes]|nr:acetate permease ActP [Klebsiella aerogenes]